MNMMSPRPLHLFASELAACIGRHKYNTQEEAVLAVLKREEPYLYTLLQSQNEEDDAEDIFNNLSGDTQAALIADAGKADDAKGVIEAVNAATEKIKGLGIKDEVKIEKLTKVVQSKHFTEFGTKKEESVAKQIEKSTRKPVTKSNAYKHEHLCSANGYDVSIGGRTDGITIDADGEQMIIEIKNRVRRLFRSVPEYERIQIMAYLYIFDIKKGQLVESYNGDTITHDIIFDDEYWKDIVHGVHGFIRVYDEAVCQAVSIMEAERDAQEQVSHK